MEANDNLRELWCSQPMAAPKKGGDLMELVQRKTRQFDRLIFMRNAAECVSAAAVTVMFAAMAVRAPDTLQRTGLLVVAASGLWIIYFLLRYGRAPAPADPAQELSGYRRALVERYDRQIRLLKAVKYWYLLPPWIGLLIGSAGVMLSQVRRDSLGWHDFIAPAVYTAVFALVWWLNESYGVARLRAERARVLALAGEDNPPDDSQ